MEIHRCRFADYVPKSINAIRFTPSSWTGRPYMAVGRVNGDIELWNCVNGLSLERIIPGPAGINLESMVWSHQIELSEDDKLFYDTEPEQKKALYDLRATPPRLFTAGLNGAIIEWSLSNMLPKTAVDSYGGAVWCMAVNNAQTIIAVGTDDGYVRLFDIADGNLSYLRSLDPIERRILSMCWSNDDSYIYCGSTDGSIRKYDVKKGQIVSRMTTIRGKKDVPLVWSVIMLADDTLVSGDSRGNVIFWDTRVDVAFQFFNSHTADVLCLEYDRVLDAVYASGVDQKVVQFLPSSDSDGIKGENVSEFRSHSEPEKLKKWIQVGSRRAHTHDVRSIAVNTSEDIDVIVSGGVDGRISILKASKFIYSNQTHMPTFPTNNSVLSLSKTNQLMVMRMENELKLWKLGSNTLNTSNKTIVPTMINSQNSAQLIIKLQLQTSSTIVASTISPNGRFVAASDNREVKLFKVLGDLDNQESINLQKVENFFNLAEIGLESLSALPRFATQLHFTSDNKKLIIATTELMLYIISIEEKTTTDEFTGESSTDYNFSIAMANCQHRLPFDFELGELCSNSVASKDNIHVCVSGSNVANQENASRLKLRSFSSINSIASSSDSRWLATSDTSGKIVISDLSDFSIHSELPHLDNANTDIPVSMAFVDRLDSSTELAIGFTSQKVLLWNIENSNLSQWSELNPPQNFPRYFIDLTHKMSNLVSNPSEPGVIYAWGTDYMVKIDTNIPVPADDLVFDINERQKAQELIVSQVKAELLKAYSSGYVPIKHVNSQNKKRKSKKSKSEKNKISILNGTTKELANSHIDPSLAKEPLANNVNNTQDPEFDAINFKIEANVDNKPAIQVSSSKKSRNRLVKKKVEVSSTENNSSASLDEYFTKFFDGNNKSIDSKINTSSTTLVNEKLSNGKRKNNGNATKHGLNGGHHNDDLETIKEEIKAVAISRLLDAGVITENDQFNFSYTKKYNPIMSLGFIAPNKLAIVERPWFDTLSALPAALSRKKFGN